MGQPVKVSRNADALPNVQVSRPAGDIKKQKRKKIANLRGLDLRASMFQRIGARRVTVTNLGHKHLAKSV